MVLGFTCLSVCTGAVAWASSRSASVPVIVSAAVSPSVVRSSGPLPDVVVRVRRVGAVLVYLLACDAGVSCGGKGKNVALARTQLSHVGIVHIALASILRRSLLLPRVTHLRPGVYDVMLATGGFANPNVLGDVKFRVR